MKTKILIIKNSKYTSFVLLGGILFSVIFYMYCINSAVRFAVVRGTTMSEISSIQDNLSELESKYMTNVNSITLESARNSGFVDPKVKDFITRDSLSPKTKSITLNR